MEMQNGEAVQLSVYSAQSPRYGCHAHFLHRHCCGFVVSHSGNLNERKEGRKSPLFWCTRRVDKRSCSPCPCSDVGTTTRGRGSGRGRGGGKDRNTSSASVLTVQYRPKCQNAQISVCRVSVVLFVKTFVKVTSCLSQDLPAPAPTTQQLLR